MRRLLTVAALLTIIVCVLVALPPSSREQRPLPVDPGDFFSGSHPAIYRL